MTAGAMASRAAVAELIKANVLPWSHSSPATQMKLFFNQRTGPVGSKSARSCPHAAALAVVTIVQPSPIALIAPKNFRRDLSIVSNDISGSAATSTAHILRPKSAPDAGAI